MEASSYTIPSHTTTLAGSQPFYSSQTSSNVLLPLSPLSFPPSSTSLTPTTLESIQSFPCSNSSSNYLDEHKAHCRSSVTTFNQDDLTWLNVIKGAETCYPFSLCPRSTCCPNNQNKAPIRLAVSSSWLLKSLSSTGHLLKDGETLCVVGLPGKTCALTDIQKHALVKPFQFKFGFSCADSLSHSLLIVHTSIPNSDLRQPDSLRVLFRRVDP